MKVHFARFLCAVSALFALAVTVSTPACASASYGYVPPEAKAEQLSKAYSTDMVSRLRTVQLSAQSPEAKRVTALVARLASQLDDTTPWTVVVYDDNDGHVPLYVLPGHQIVAYAPFVNNLSDDALGFALGHEMGHVEMGHMTRRFVAFIEASQRARRHIADRDWATAVSFADSVSDVSCEQETEADAFGARLAAQAGFDFMKGVREIQDQYGENPEDTSHPSMASRVAALATIR